MAIIGLGMDIVELERLEAMVDRHGDRFVRRFCREGEVAPRQGKALIEHLGGLWAAKEAALKALGTGWAERVTPTQAIVGRHASGAPALRFEGEARRRADALGVATCHLTITHERRYAAAFVILEATASDLDPRPNR
ncbi:MAG: holo-ACP synthase [Acidobacteriota bacterium]